MALEMGSVVLLVVSGLVLGVVVAYFITGVQMSTVEAQRVFAEGCLKYCQEIKDLAGTAGIPIDVAAVRKADALSNDAFVRACGVLHPDTINYPYLCWNRGCCGFSLPEP